MTQQQAFDILKLGHSAYLTGPAGSGKTFLLNQYSGKLPRLSSFISFLSVLMYFFPLTLIT